MSAIYTENFTGSMVIFIALLFTLYNYIVTKMNVSISGDRQNYTLNFYGYRNSSSAGLTFVIGFIRKFSSNVETLYYFSTFVTMVGTMFAYRFSEDARPKALILLLTTQYVFFTFAGMKQCYTNAFATLCIIIALRNKGIKDTIICILLIDLAIWFHHTGYLLIPVYVMLRIRKTKWSIGIFFILMIVGIVFLEPLLLHGASLISPFAPSVTRKVYEYFRETGVEALKASGVLSVFKGVPFYIITLVAWVKRHELRDEIRNYDNYLLLSGIISFIYLASFYNSWVNRLSYFFYLPVAIFFVNLMRYIHIRGNYRIIDASVIGINALFTMRFIYLSYSQYGGF